MPLNFAYFYGGEAEQYSFYRIPKILFTDPRYKSVSTEAKVLYGLMLDRLGLSIRNGWLDDAGRVFIYFTLEDAMALMGCGHGKAVKLFSELELNGIGLIERIKQGQGRPTLIYVRNFALLLDNGQTSEKLNLTILIYQFIRQNWYNPLWNLWITRPLQSRGRIGLMRWNLTES